MNEREWWVSMNDEPATLWRGATEEEAARAFADQRDVEAFTHGATDGRGWRFFTKSGDTLVVYAPKVACVFCGDPVNGPCGEHEVR